MQSSASPSKSYFLQKNPKKLQKSVDKTAFIGLMMPHMARWLVGADHRWSLPVTLLATPALLLFADIIGRVIVPGELRVSVVSAFIGAPVLIFLVRRKTRGGA